MPTTAEVFEPHSSADERERIWEKQKRDMPGFAEYEVRTTRPIPVVILKLSETNSSLAG